MHFLLSRTASVTMWNVRPLYQLVARVWGQWPRAPRLRAVVSPGAPSEVQVTLPHSARDEADFRAANQTIVILGCVSDHVATTAMEHLVIVTRPVVLDKTTFTKKL